MKKIALLSLCCFFSFSAFAETGSLETISSGTYQITTNDFGDSKSSVIVTKLAGIVTKSDLSFIKAGALIVSECGGASTSDSKGSKVEGTCLSTDADGDKYKINFSRSNTIGGSNPGTQTWVGLTGKYVGMTATCTYENKSQVISAVVYGSNLNKCTVTK
jgi:hypothetical protein